MSTNPKHNNNYNRNLQSGKIKSNVGMEKGDKYRDTNKECRSLGSRGTKNVNVVSQINNSYYRSGFLQSSYN